MDRFVRTLSQLMYTSCTDWVVLFLVLSTSVIKFFSIETFATVITFRAHVHSLNKKNCINITKLFHGWMRKWVDIMFNKFQPHKDNEKKPSGLLIQIMTFYLISCIFFSNFVCYRNNQTKYAAFILIILLLAMMQVKWVAMMMMRAYLFG